MYDSFRNHWILCPVLVQPKRRDQALHTLEDVCRTVKWEIVWGLVDWLFVLFQDGKDAEIACLLLAV